MKKEVFSKTLIDSLIVEYLTGSITKTDLARLENWIGLSDENRLHFNNFKDSWIISGRKNSSGITNTDESWIELKERLKDKSDYSHIYLPKLIKQAASWLLFFACGSALTWWISNKHDNSPADLTDRGKLIEIVAPLGSRAVIRMPDSTKIWLNAGTKLLYNQDYGKITRTLHLTGEAYFKVASDKEHPFIVNTQGIVIRALGTRFNVKAYSDEKTISTTLEEGRIDVHVSGAANKEHVILKSNEKLIYYKATKRTESYTESSEDRLESKIIAPVAKKEVLVLSNVRTELYTSWKDPRWIIDREPLNTLAPMLERRFNLKIIFDDDQVRNYKFTGTIENESIYQIMNALKLTAPLFFKINKDTVFLTIDPESKDEFRRIMTRNK